MDKNELIEKRIACLECAGFELRRVKIYGDYLGNRYFVARNYIGRQFDLSQNTDQLVSNILEIIIKDFPISQISTRDVCFLSDILSIICRESEVPLNISNLTTFSHPQT